MKNLILFLTLLSCTISLHAQDGISRYEFGVGGLPIIYPNGMLETGYSLRANFAYFPTNKISIGLIPFLGKVQDMQGFGANIYSRYYLNDAKFSVFLEGAIGLGSIKYENTPLLNGLLNTINLGPGLVYRINQNLGFELLIQYARLVNVSFPEETYTGDTFIPSIGVQYRINTRSL